MDVVQASQLVESVGWAETLAIWKRKIQMLKEISGVNEAPSPVPSLALVSVLGQTPGVRFSSDRHQHGGAEEMKLRSQVAL